MALPVVATSWQALIGYVAVVVAFIVVSLKVTRNKNLLFRLQSLPEHDRARVLQMEMGAAYLETGLSPEHWLQQQRQRYYFVGFLTVCALVLALVGGALLRPNVDPETREVQLKAAAQEAAKGFVAKLYSGDFNAAYELLSDDLKKNLSFAQFRDDFTRILYQAPGDPLRNSVEQVIENGGYLSVLVDSEFSVETKVRNVVTFTKGATEWKLTQYNWQPLEWPLVWPTATQIQPSAGEAMKAYGRLDSTERAEPLPSHFRGTVTGSTPGWKVVVDSTAATPDLKRCSINANDVDSPIAIKLKKVVGGCRLQSGQRIFVQAVMTGISEAGIELDDVRYFPES